MSGQNHYKLWSIRSTRWKGDTIHVFSTRATNPKIAKDKFQSYYPDGKVKTVKPATTEQKHHLK